LANQKYGSASHHIYYTLLYQVHSIAAALFTRLSKLSKYAGEKPFQELNRHILTFPCQFGEPSFLREILHLIHHPSSCQPSSCYMSTSYQVTFMMLVLF
jgi:hypothetical protein